MLAGNLYNRKVLFIHGIGHFHPEVIIDNAFLESLDIGTNDQWIMDRVGIRRRRTVLPLDYIRSTRNRDPRESRRHLIYSNAETGAAAARMAIERSGITPADIGWVISAGCSPQYSVPAEACLVAAELGLKCPAFDLNSACSSFVVQLHLLRAMDVSMVPDYVLLLNVESNTRTVDYSDRSAAVLWGDGGAAAVVSLRHRSHWGVHHSMVVSDSSGWNKVFIPAGGHFQQNGPAVQAFAVKKTLSTLHAMRSFAGGSPERWHFVGHQANLTMLKSVCERFGILPGHHHFSVDEYGNCGAAGAPSVLSEKWDDFHDGDEIALAVVGAGLTWAGALISIDGRFSDR